MEQVDNPADALKVPATHLVHTDDETAWLYWPATHSVHTVAPLGLYWPAGQLMQSAGGGISSRKSGNTIARMQAL